MGWGEREGVVGYLGHTWWLCGGNRARRVDVSDVHSKG